ncbi:MAG TPA: signal peptidase II, partial [Gemmatimonadaceae bacterium]|nr:signal peptidase II [Gemmatimonadaceae bacterium]
MSTSTRNGRVFWTAVVAVIVVDVITKALAVRYLMPQHVPHPIIGEVVRFTLAFNPGAAFSMSLGDNSRYIFGAFAVVALYILWRLYRTSAPGDTLRVLALGLACGGAAGNLIDRFRSSNGV